MCALIRTIGMRETDPLHSGRMWEPYYWACEQPERPGDNFTRYDLRCRGCFIAAEAVLRLQPDLADALRYTAPRTLRDFVENARKWWAEQ